MTYADLVNQIRSAVSGTQAVADAAAYRQYPLKLSFSSYTRGIHWLGERYLAAGLESEVISFPADGRTTYADRHFPLAWDVDEGWLDVADSQYPEQRLADYREDPYGIVPFSADSKGIREAVIVPAEALKQTPALPKDRPVMALLPGYPTTADALWAMELGCQAIVACPRIDPTNAVSYQARRWFNDIFGMGQIDGRHPTMPGFSISPRQTVALQTWYQAHGPVPVRYLLRARTFAGTAPLVTARIPGREEPDREVLVTAHAYEPNAANNCSGVALCLEAARVLAALIRSGALPPPRRSIRFMHGLETWGVYAYAMKNRAAIGKALCGFTLDSLGSADWNGVPEAIEVSRNPYVHPFFSHALMEEAAGLAARRLRLDRLLGDGTTTNDDVLNDPLFGPAWTLCRGNAMFTAGFYHTNADVPEKLAPERMAECAAMGAAVAYFAAAAGLAEAPELARMAYRAAVGAITERCHLAIAAIGQDPAGNREQGLKLRAFADIAVPAGLAAIESASAVLAAADRAHFRRRTVPLTRAYRRLAAAQVKATLQAMAPVMRASPLRTANAQLTALERQASRMVPERALPGHVGLGTIPESARTDAARLIGYHCLEYWSFCGVGFLWFDGKRSVLEAARAYWALTPWNRPESPEARQRILKMFVDLTAFLEKYGYVKVARRPV